VDTALRANPGHGRSAFTPKRSLVRSQYRPPPPKAPDQQVQGPSVFLRSSWSGRKPGSVAELVAKRLLEVAAPRLSAPLAAAQIQLGSHNELPAVTRTPAILLLHLTNPGTTQDEWTQRWPCPRGEVCTAGQDRQERGRAATSTPRIAPQTEDPGKPRPPDQGHAPTWGQLPDLPPACGQPVRSPPDRSPPRRSRASSSGWLSAAFPQLLARCPRSCREQLPYAEVEVDVGERRRDERTGLDGAADGDNNTWLRGPAPLPGASWALPTLPCPTFTRT
jgi:hypothetical protein